MRQRPTIVLVLLVLVGLLCMVTLLISAFALFSSLLMTPRGRWDEDTLQGMELSAMVAGLFAVLGAGLLSVPIYARAVRWWALGLPAALLCVAIARFAWTVTTYPMQPT